MTGKIIHQFLVEVNFLKIFYSISPKLLKILTKNFLNQFPNPVNYGEIVIKIIPNISDFYKKLIQNLLENINYI